MRYKRVLLASFISMGLVLGVNLTSVNATIPGVNEHVDLTSSGVIGNLNAGGGVLSNDGRYAAFSSRASNLVANDTNNTWDIFVRDRIANTLTRVSVSTSGAQGNQGSDGTPSISNDGRYVVFNSSATNFVTGDTNGTNDVFIHDMQLNTTQLVSSSSSGVIGNSSAANPVISGDGKFVAFEGYASNLVSPSTSGSNVFVKNLATGNIQLISKNASGTYGNGSSWGPSISCDGGVVAFHSNASNLVATDTNGYTDVFVTVRAGGDAHTNITSGANNASGTVSVSCDGMHVAYTSNASNLVASDTNVQQDVFKFDRRSNVTSLVSVDGSGTQGNGLSNNPTISSDGTLVAFTSTATNLVSGDTNSTSDVFLKDTQTNSLYRVSVDSTGQQGNANSSLVNGGQIGFSNDKKYLYFTSYATNLITNDTGNAGGGFIAQTGL